MKTDPEEIVLAAVLIDEDRVVRVASRLRPEQFRDERNRLIFAAMCYVYEQKVDVNLVTIKSALNGMFHEGRPALQFVGETYVNLLAVGVPPFKEAFESALLDLMARPRQETGQKIEPPEEWPDFVGDEDEGTEG